MTDRNDVRTLTKALNQIKATSFQVTAAATLLAVNGLDNALEFVLKMGELNKEREANNEAKH